MKPRPMRTVNGRERRYSSDLGVLRVQKRVEREQSAFLALSREAAAGGEARVEDPFLWGVPCGRLCGRVLGGPTQ
eukprot:1905664-Pyramimonas_sp.AAC.1